MVASPNVGITLIDQSQSQKEVTANNAFLRLEVPFSGVIDRALNTPPGSPVNGDSYIIGGAPTGVWTGKANNVAFYYGGWYFIAPKEGFTIWVNDEDISYTYSGSAWAATINPSQLQNLSMLGINATADATNKLSLRSNAALFSALYAADSGNGDIQLKVNKETASDSASYLFQTNFSGRAEFGTLGDDNFTLKTSPDGSAWLDVLKMMAATGRVAFKSIATGLSGAGSTQGTATAITKTLSEFTTVAASTGGRLPTPEAGEFFFVANKGANALSVYPASGGTINSLSANAALSVAADSRKLFFAFTSTQWYSI